MAFLPNQPIIFIPDDPCNDCGNDFAQLAEQGDLISFQLPNPCIPTLTEKNADAFATDYAGQDVKRDGTGNGGTVAWTFNVKDVGQGGGHDAWKTKSISKIYSWNIALTQFLYYVLKFRVNIPAGNEIVFVGFKSYASPASTDYDILGRYSGAVDSLTAGVLEIDFIADVDYIRFGFYIDGTDVATDNWIGYLSLKEETFESECISVCIQDTDGNVVATISGANYIQYYHTHINVSKRWGEMSLEAGCYKICICTEDDPFFGENLFTAGDNGTMESGITGLESSTNTIVQNGAVYYSGIKSLRATLTNDPSQVLMKTSSDLTLKPFHSYKIKCRVKFVNGYVPNHGDSIAWSLSNFTGSSDIDIPIIYNSPFGIDWLTLEMTFTTGYDPVGGFAVTLTQVSNQFNVKFVYIDQVILYDVDDYVTCSQIFNLANLWDCSLLLSWTNDENAFGFDYSTGLIQYLRIAGRLQYPKYPMQEDDYVDSSGNYALLYAMRTKIQELAIEDIPEYLHDALSIGFIHDNFYIDGIKYLKFKGDISPIWRRDSRLAPLKQEVLNASQDNINSSC